MADYYTSQFSGEEIDAALRAAQIISGADTPAALREKLEIYGSNTALSPTDPTTVETALKYRTNPNLLDNWYFGRPVDQRKGYIVPAGVEYYKVDGFVPQGPIPETVRVDYIDYAGSARFNYGGVPCYVPKDGGYVRGYTAAGYTVDRWKAQSLQGTVTCENDCLAIENTNDTAASIIIDEIFEPDLSNALKGKTLTLSVMAKSVTGKFTFQSGDKNLEITEPGLSYLMIPDWVDKYNYGMRYFNSGGAGKIEISAIKLELGDTQTLAHKENGVWVLNEIPDFGEQLRRCMYYAEKIEDGNTPVITNATFIPAGATSATFVLPYERKRTYPSIRFNDVSNYRVIVRSMSGNTSAFGISNISILDVGATKAAVLVTFSSATSQDWYGFLQRADNTSGGYAFISADL